MYGQCENSDDLDLNNADQYALQQPNGSNSGNELDVTQQQPESSNADSYVYVYEIGFYGLRKKCLYLFVILATVAIVINAALTLWIIAVISFSMDGIGKLRIEPNSLHLSGDAFLYNEVYATSIRSRKDENLRIQSDNSIMINARNSNSVVNRLFIGNSDVNSVANEFLVRSPDGTPVFSVSESNVFVATDKLRVNNAAGIKFNGSIQVPLVQSSTLDDKLSLLSPTQRIKIKGPQKVSVQSRMGHISANCDHALHFRSKEKIIHLDSSQIEFGNLRIAYPTKRGRTYPGIYQLCMCADNAKLFIVPPEGLCISDGSVCL